jgi:hypothetical protein
MSFQNPLKPGEPLQRRFFVVLHQRSIAGNVGKEDGGELSVLDFWHGVELC